MPASAQKKLYGHWISGSAISEANVGDTVIYRKKKYDRVDYLWAGAAYAGIEFNKDSSFAEHRNVNCSDETSDDFHTGSYEVKEGNIIEFHISVQTVLRGAF